MIKNPALNRFAILGSLLTSFSASCLGAVNLTATPREYSAEGVNYRELVFGDGERKVFVELPAKWGFRSSPAKLEFTAPESRFISASIESAAVVAPRLFDAATVEGLVAKSVAEIPSSATRVTTETRANPVLIGDRESLEVLVTYRLGDATYQRSTIFLDLPESQLTFRFSAPKEQF